MTKSNNPFEKFWKKWDKFAEAHESGDFRWGYYAVKKELNALLEKQAKKSISSTRSPPKRLALGLKGYYIGFYDGKADAFRLVQGNAQKEKKGIK